MFLSIDLQLTCCLSFVWLHIYVARTKKYIHYMVKSTHVLLQLLQFAPPLFLLCISDSPHLVSRNNKKRN